MTPDAIVVVPAGIVSEKDAEGNERWRTTTFDEADAFGTLGGRDRVEATALLAKRYPSAFVVSTSHKLSADSPTIASIYGGELKELGVAPERIVEVAAPTTTQSGVEDSLALARERGWKRLAFVSSGYHLPRIKAFYEKAQSDIEAEFISADALLAEHDPVFAKYFEEIQNTPAYLKRVESEARGLKAIQDGSYRAAQAADKEERPV